MSRSLQSVHVHVLICLLTLFEFTRLSSVNSLIAHILQMSADKLPQNKANLVDNSEHSTDKMEQSTGHATGSPPCVYAENRVVAYSMLTSTDQ